MQFEVRCLGWDRLSVLLLSWGICANDSAVSKKREGMLVADLCVSYVIWCIPYRRLIWFHKIQRVNDLGIGYKYYPRV